MSRPLARLALCLSAMFALASPTWAQDGLTLDTRDGAVQGTTVADGKVQAFLGLPYAAPPVGDLRWRAPQPETGWTGVRDAGRYRAHCLQSSSYDDMSFIDGPASEDCLYLNVFRPTDAPPGARLPVMVWIHGGGYQAGAASEARHWGAFLPQRGVILVTLNYRLGLFGFLTSPQLDAEAGSSGNYGLMDMVAALSWVKADIAAFGGDPSNVTIFGESAGAYSVSFMMGAPSARGLFQKVIGESGAALGPRFATPLAKQEQINAPLLLALGGPSLTDLRAVPAQTLLNRAIQAHADLQPVVDGQFIAEPLAATYAAGRQAHVPLLAGWNRDEGGYVPGGATVQSWAAEAKARFGDRADAVLALYPAATDVQAARAKADYQADNFIACATWTWIDAQRRTGGAPIYRYQFDLAAPKSQFHDETAFHSDDIEYVFGTLDSRPVAAWRAEDRQLSRQIMAYWTNFAKTGDPNGAGLPVWPAFSATGQVLHLDQTINVQRDDHKARCEFLNNQAKP